MSLTQDKKNSFGRPWLFAAVPALLMLMLVGVWQLSLHPILNKSTRNVTITLQRDACYGSCPTYMLTIKGDGTVNFEPTPGPIPLDERPTPVAGRAQISAASVQELIGAFESSGFFTMNDEYSQYETTDLPWATTAISIDGRTKKVRHYYGDSHAPKELTELETKIDEVAGTDRWLRPK